VLNGAILFNNVADFSRRCYDLDRDIFKLVAGMRGSSTRIQQLLSLLNVPKNNKLQLAKNLGMDWKTI
jgi:hypothetical protein